MKRKFINLMLLLPFLASCSGNDEYISAGFNQVIGQSNPTSQVGVGLKAKKVQTFESSFDVYVGARLGFAKEWEKDEYHLNPGFGTFAIRRTIYNDNDKAVSHFYKMLYDFPNDEKYPMKIESIKGSFDGYKTNFTTFFTFNYDFSLIDFDEGTIAFFVVYYDDINDKEYEGNVFQYYGTDSESFRFKKNKDNKTITLSSY